MTYAYEEPGYIKIQGSIKKDAYNKYNFVCPYCKTKLVIGTDGGRYGNIGDFRCQHCGELFHATDDDNNPYSPLHVYGEGKKLMDIPWGIKGRNEIEL